MEQSSHFHTNSRFSTESPDLKGYVRYSVMGKLFFYTYYRSTKFDSIRKTTSFTHKENVRQLDLLRVTARLCAILSKPEFCNQFLQANLSGQRFIADRFDVLFKQFFLLVHFYHREYILLVLGLKVKCKSSACSSVLSVSL